MRRFNWVLTGRCNLSCSYCCDNSSLSKKTVRIFNLSKALKIVKELVGNFDHIIFTGGEVLLESGLFPLIRECRKNKLTVSVLTNGTLLTQDNCQNLIKSGVNKIVISLDSLDQGINDMVRSKHFLVMKGLNNLIRLRPPQLDVKIFQTISAINIESIKLMVEFCKEKNIRLRLNPVDVDSGSKFYNELSLYGLTDNMLNKLQEQFQFWIDWVSNGDKKKKKSLNKYLENIYSFIKGNLPKKINCENCDMGTNNFVLDADGSVHACFLRRDLFCGNVHDTSLATILYKSKDILKEKKQKINCVKLRCLCFAKI